MREFKDNKEGKINELKVRRTRRFLVWPYLLCLPTQSEISKQKSAVQKQAVVVKTHQKEHQTAILELGGQECVPFTISNALPLPKNKWKAISKLRMLQFEMLSVKSTSCRKT